MTVKIKPVVGGQLSVTQWADRLLTDGGTPVLRAPATPRDEGKVQRSDASYAVKANSSKGNPSRVVAPRKGKHENV